MRQGKALVLAVLALATAAAGCSDGERKQGLESYVEDANRIQRQAAPELTRANEAYARFAGGALDADRTPVELAGAESTLRGIRSDLDRLRPPDEARTLHSNLLRFFDLHIALAAETTQLARYLPRAESVLRAGRRASRTLSRRLERASQPASQARALARYRSSLQRTARRLRRLDPPPLVASSHREQVERLGAISRLALQLERAIERRDSRGVARLLLRFRRVQERREGATLIDEGSVRDYRRRHRQAERQAAAVRREEARLHRDILADE